MKLPLLFTALLCTCALAAQTSFRSVTESSTDDEYSFSVRLDGDQQAELFDIYRQLADVKVKGLTGTSETTFDEGVTLVLNTRRNQLSLRYAADNKKAAQLGEKMVAEIKETLGIVPPPAPPAPPTPIKPHGH